MFDVQCSRSFGVDFFITGYKDRGLGAVVVGDCENRIISLRFG